MQKHLGNLRNAQTHLHQFLGMGEHLFGRGIHSQMGAVQHKQTIGQPGHVFHGMGNHHNGGIFALTVRFDIGKNLRSANGIQTSSRLVKNQNLRFHGNHTGNRHTALLTAGQIKRRYLELLFRQANEAGSFPDTAVNLIALKTHVFGAKSNILIHRFFKQLVFGILENKANPKTCLPGQLLVRPNILAIQQNRAGGRLQKAVQLLHQRRLTGTGMSDDADKFTPVYGKGNILQRLVLKRRADAVYIV